MQNDHNGSILQYFRPLLSYHLSLKSLFLSIFEWPFTEVLLYLNIFFPETTGLIEVKFHMETIGLRKGFLQVFIDTCASYRICSNDDSGFTLTCFTTRSSLNPNAFIWEKILKS